jgi:hypothetical protein
MYTGDEVIFESVMFESVVLSASPTYWYFNFDIFETVVIVIVVITIIKCSYADMS